MTYVIAQTCVDVKDKAYLGEYPIDCIYEGERSLYTHPDKCVDCGAREPVCPVEAIFYEDDTPEQWKDYYKANVEFFDDIGSPAAPPSSPGSPRISPDRSPPPRRPDMANHQTQVSTTHRRAKPQLEDSKARQGCGRSLERWKMKTTAVSCESGCRLFRLDQAMCCSQVRSQVAMDVEVAVHLKVRNIAPAFGAHDGLVRNRAVRGCGIRVWRREPTY
jgi:NAD-dependent dihydropyrimidine dehydrogenase PreA subunit